MTELRKVTVTNLPADPATGAKQDAGNSSLASLDAKIAAPMLTSFGQQSVAEERCVIWSNFGATILDRLWATALTGTGTVTVSNGRALVSAGTNGTATLRSKRAVRYIPGQGVVMRFTAPMPVITAASGRVYIGLGSHLTNGFGLGNDAVLGVFSWFSNNGVLTERFVSTDWLDKADGSGTLPAINWNYGTPISLRFRWLGYGGYQIEILSANAGWVLADRLDYLNTSAETWCRNPSFEAFIYAINTTGSGDSSIYCPSIGVFTEGSNELLGVLRGDDQLLSLGAAAGTFVPIISFRCESTLNGVANLSRLLLASVSIFNEATNNGLRALVLRNATLGGATAFTAMSATQSITAVDVGSTTVTYTNLNILRPFGVGPNGSQTLDLLSIGHQLAPGDVVTLAVARTGGGAAVNVYGGISVLEQL